MAMFDSAVFDGATLIEEDQSRLAAQLARVFFLMKDGEWRTLSQIAGWVESPEASVSARLRDLRKERFGAHKVERERIGRGLFKYRLVVNTSPPEEKPQTELDLHA